MALKPSTIARIQAMLDATREQAAAPRTIVQESINQEPTMSVQEPSEESLGNADEIIQKLIDEEQGDYSALRREIALDVYENGHFNGNWDVSFYPSEHGDDQLSGFRVIQEDEYDQHMDEDEDKPDYETMVGGVPNGYLWML